MAKVPSGGRKPTKKKAFELADYKKKTNLIEVPDKPVEWLECSKALQKITGLPGFPIGYTSLSRGYSNTGKSTSLLEGMVGSQQAGRLPIIFDLENNIGRYRLEKMGFDWGGNVIKLDNSYLLEKFGKKKLATRNEASIEDLASAIHDFINQQEAGLLPIGIDFFIDSIGVLNCVKSINAAEKDSSDNNMWNAGAYEHAFKSLLNTRIPSSRKETCEFSNSLVAVQKIWLDSMQGKGAVKHKGGEAFYFGSRLIYHFGGTVSHGAKSVSATSKKKDVAYGIEANIKVPKNHIDGPLGGISMEGKIISTPHGFIGADLPAIKDYKTEQLTYFRDILGEDIEAEDILTNYHAIDTVGDVQDQGIDDFNKSMKSNFDNLDVDPETGEINE